MNSEPALNLSEYNVLIVDDAPVNLGVIVTFLESYGLGIRIARSGESALQRVQYDLPDIILLDVLMSGMDGFETCRHLKENEATRDVPVIMMTSLSDIENKVKGFEAGAVDYVTKPLHQQEVLARITTHLQLRQLTKNLQEKNRELQVTSEQEKNRLFEAVKQQREQLRVLNSRLTEVKEAEHKQLARELHDELGQSLTAIYINLMAIKKELNGRFSGNLIERIDETEKLTAQTLDQVREMSLNLRPPMLDDLGLIPTLQWYIKRFEKRVQIETILTIGPQVSRLSAEVETTLFRIVQEALTNVAKHAKADTVHINLMKNRGEIYLEITDDGIGFNLDEVVNPSNLLLGTGLLGIRERVLLLNGQVTIYSSPGDGTTISVKVAG